MNRLFCVSALLAIASVAHAGVMLDLRTPSGEKSVTLTSGASGCFDLQMWAQITGENSRTDDDGIQYFYLWIKTNNNGLTGLTGITSQPTRASTMYTPGVTPDGTFENGDLVGATKLTTWNAKSNVLPNIPPMTSLSGAAFPASGEYNIIDDHTVEFLLGTATYNYSNFGGVGTAAINVEIPTWTAKLLPAGSYYMDYGSEKRATQITSATSPDVSIGSPVVIATIPEPATLVLLGMGALALVFIRRK